MRTRGLYDPFVSRDVGSIVGPSLVRESSTNRRGIALLSTPRCTRGSKPLYTSPGLPTGCSQGGFKSLSAASWAWTANAASRTQALM